MTELAFINAVDRVNSVAIKGAIVATVPCGLIYFFICKLGYL